MLELFGGSRHLQYYRKFSFRLCSLKNPCPFSEMLCPSLDMLFLLGNVSNNSCSHLNSENIKLLLSLHDVSLKLDSNVIIIILIIGNCIYA